MPEPGFGVAGLDCAQMDDAERATNKRANKAIGERCISFLEHPRLGRLVQIQVFGCGEQLLRWQRDFDFMTRQLLQAQPEREFCHPTWQAELLPCGPDAKRQPESNRAQVRTKRHMRSPLVYIFARHLVVPSLLALSLFGGAVSAGAQQVRIPLPKKSKYTPVQALNRDG